MLSPLVCISFKNKDDDDDLSVNPCLIQQKTSRKINPCSKPSRRSRKDKNPYSNLGLHKFSALLADLQEKKKKIYLRKDSQNISFVRFAYSNSNDVVPIVVKSKLAVESKNPIESPSVAVSPVEEIKELPCLVTEKIKFPKKKFWGNLGHPSYYVAGVVIMILLLLIVFGRSVTILFTTIIWYMIPLFKGNNLKPEHEPLKKKKKYLRRFSENNMTVEGRKKKELMRNFSEMKIVRDGIASP